MARFILLDRKTWTRPGHRKDCTVRALALTCDLTYEEAHAHAERCGRKKNRGFHPAQLFPYRRIAGHHFHKKRQKVNGAELVNVEYPTGLTIAQFLDRNRKGRFIISTRCHAMAVIDGAIHDLWQMRESTKLCKVMTLKVPRRRKRTAIEPPMPRVQIPLPLWA